MPFSHSGSLSSKQSASQRTQVYFDGACPVCRREIQYYQSLDQQKFCEWIDISSETAGSGLIDLDRAAALRRFHIRRADGRLVSGARAFIYLWAQLPRTQALARYANNPIVRNILEVGYRLFLQLRRMWRRPG